MSNNLTSVELRIASIMLNLASDKFGTHGCSDFFLKDETNLTEEQRHDLVIAMETWNGDKEELKRLQSLDPSDNDFDHTNDWYLMGYLSARMMDQATIAAKPRTTAYDRPRKRLRAWLQEHNAHGLSYEGPHFLPDGDKPEIGEWIRAPWLDEDEF